MNLFWPFHDEADMKQSGAKVSPSADAQCATCSPWSRIEQRDLDTVHQLWLAERITPHNGGAR